MKTNLQWCRLMRMVKSLWHFWHMVTRSSGTQMGALSPRAPTETFKAGRRRP